jgi:hypothetical protein
MLQISQEQIQFIYDAIFRANMGVQDYKAVQAMLNSLPETPIPNPPENEA